MALQLIEQPVNQRMRIRSDDGALALVEADAMKLGFSSASFDAVVTSCTMCSVPDPVRALQELYRVLRPGGDILIYEHVPSRNALSGLALDLMTLLTRRAGTEMNRDTVGNFRRTGFSISNIESVYLDIILAIRWIKPSCSDADTR